MLPGFDIEGALSEIEIALQSSDLDRATRRLLDLKDNVTLPRDLAKSVILLNGDYTQLHEERRNNTLTYEAHRLATARLSERILDLCHDLRQLDRPSRSARDSGWSEGDENSATAVDTNVVSPRVVGDREPRSARPVVTMAQVALQYRGFRLFVEDLQLDEGMLLGVVGANSSGKTSLLRILAGDLRPSAGKVEYPQLGNIPQDWYGVKRQIGYVEQLPERWPGLAIDMLRFEAAAYGHLEAANETWVYRWVDRLRLGEHVNKTWHQLSGGFKTRFELARALIRKPRLLVLDEPLAALDPPAQITFLWDLQTFCKDQALAIAISSQHLHEVEAFAHKVLFIRDGSIARFVPNDDQCHLETAFDGVSDETHVLMRSIDAECRFDGYAFHFQVKRTNLSDVLLKLGSLPYRMTYFRDVSTSTARLFE